MSQPNNIFSLSYTGVRAQRPPNIIQNNFDPKPTDAQNVVIGDFWINFSSGNPNLAKIWVLLGLAGGVANWVQLASSSGDILTLSGNTGGLISPLSGNIAIETGNSTVEFAGTNPGFLTLSFGIPNLILGGNNGSTITSGTRNVGLGFAALQSITSGDDNVAIGYQSLLSDTTGSGNTVVGSLAANLLVDGSQNTVFGNGAYSGATNANGNIAIGHTALSGSVVSPATNNVAIGNESMLVSTTATENTAVGSNTLSSLTTGQLNLALGINSGSVYDSTESSNILLGNIGTIADANTIRIGTQGSAAGQQNKAFMAGVVGVTVSNPQTVVINSATGQLGVGAGGGTPLETLTGNSGGAVSPTAGNINVIGDTFATTVTGTPGSNQLEVTLVTPNGVYIGDTWSWLDVDNNATPFEIKLDKSRLSGPIMAGDGLGLISFYGTDSASNPVLSAQISAMNPAGSTIGAGQIAGSLTFLTHPDSAVAAIPRMAINPTGSIVIGKSDNDNFTNLGVTTFQCEGASIISANDLVNTTGAITQLLKTRNLGPIVSGDTIGSIAWTGYDSASNPIQAANIVVTNTGTIGAQRVAGIMSFFTHPDSASALATQRMSINQTGNVSIQTPDTASAALQVAGSISAQGDPGVGVAASTDLTNTTATAAGGGTVTFHANAAGNIVQTGWMKFYINGVASYVPYFQTI